MTKTQNINIAEMTMSWAKAQKLSHDYFETIDSTNSLAKEEALEADLSPVHLYIAQEQTAGRGRFDRKWVSPEKGSALLMSYSFQIQQKVSPYITALIGKALFLAAKNTWPFVHFQLKAPNDLLIAGHKVAGLLVESVAQGNQQRVIIGLGFNILNQPQSVENSISLIKALAESKYQLTGDDWVIFLDRFLFEISLALQTEINDQDYNFKLQLLTLFSNSLKTYNHFDELKEDLWR